MIVTARKLAVVLANILAVTGSAVDRVIGFLRLVTL